MSKEMVPTSVPKIPSLGDALESVERRRFGDRAGSWRNDVIPATKGRREEPVDPEVFRQKMEQCMALIKDPLQPGYIEKILGKYGLLHGEGARKALRIFDKFIEGNDFSIAQFQGLVAQSENSIRQREEPEDIEEEENM